MENYLQLVKKAKKGDAEAFALLYEKIYENLYKFALYTLRNPSDAEDAVSETVIAAFSSIEKLRTEEAFQAWMYKILSNQCKSKLREYTKKTVELTEEMIDFSMEGAFVEMASAEDYIVRKTFFELEDEERMIVGMHVFGGYKSREIAEILHMNENTVRSKENRALKKMGQKLNAEEVRA